MTANNFSGPKAAETMLRIEALLAARGTVTVADIAKEVGMARGTANNYTREMWLAGRIRKVGSSRPSIPIVWELGQDLNASEAADSTLLPARRVVTIWIPHHARNWFDCLLFGVPAAMQGALA